MLALFFISIAFLVGSMMPFQATINNQLTRYSHHPLHSALISFIIGTLSLAILCLTTKESFPTLKVLSKVSPHLYLGGLMGASFVFFSMFLIDKIGVTTTITSFITGQLLMSILIDHYGLMGVQVSPLNWGRLLGALFLILGLGLIVKSRV